MIDWVQVLFAGIGAGFGSAISVKIKTKISTIKSGAVRVLIVIAVITLYLAVGIALGLLVQNILPDHQRLEAGIRAFTVFGAICIALFGRTPNKPPPKNKK